MTKTALAANGPLDWLNLLLADVTGGAGPFLAIYLMASQQWSAGRIGIAASAPERVAGADGAGRCAAPTILGGTARFANHSQFR